MAVWNNQVRGNVIAIKTHMGWDPTEIVDSSNPMPTHENRNGYGSFDTTGEKLSHGPFNSPKMDATDIPSMPAKGGGSHDPDAGKGRY